MSSKEKRKKLVKGAKNLMEKAGEKAAQVAYKHLVLCAKAGKKLDKAEETTALCRTALYNEHAMLLTAVTTAKTAMKTHKVDAAKRALKGSSRIAANVATNAKKYKKSYEAEKKYQQHWDDLENFIRATEDKAPRSGAVNF